MEKTLQFNVGSTAVEERTKDLALGGGCLIWLQFQRLIFIYSHQQIFTDHLLCALSPLGIRDSDEQDRQSACSPGRGKRWGR